MSEFKKSNLHGQLNSKGSNQVQVSQANSDTPIVTDYHAPEVHASKHGNYQAVKAKFGPLASSDPERQMRSLRDRRFSLNPLLKDPLSVAQEESRVIEEKVVSRVDFLAKEAKAEAFQQGYAEGLEKGVEEAVRRFQTQGTASLARFDALIQTFEQAKFEIFKANEKFLIELIFKIARMLFLKELAVDRQYVTRLATTLMERLGVRDHIKIKINPQDAESIEMLRGNLESVLGKMTNVHIESSPTVLQGGCQVETQWNSIDASVDTQLISLHDALMGTESEGAKL